MTSEYIDWGPLLSNAVVPGVIGMSEPILDRSIHSLSGFHC